MTQTTARKSAGNSVTTDRGSPSWVMVEFNSGLSLSVRFMEVLVNIDVDLGQYQSPGSRTAQSG
jgi:hypothetical protein